MAGVSFHLFIRHKQYSASRVWKTASVSTVDQQDADVHALSISSATLHKQILVCVRKKEQVRETSHSHFRGVISVNVSTLFALTCEIGTGGRRHRGSGRGDPPGPRPACPPAGWGGSDRTPPSPVWDYKLETTALRRQRREETMARPVTVGHPNTKYESPLETPAPPDSQT